MNTVLGVLIFVLGGNITGAVTVGAYPTTKVCQAAVTLVAKRAAAQITDDHRVGILCVELADRLGKPDEPKPPTTDL